MKRTRRFLGVVTGRQFRAEKRHLQHRMDPRDVPGVWGWFAEGLYFDEEVNSCPLS